MAIKRVNPGNWKKRDDLTSNQINQLDTNITYGIDKRDGYSDVINSNITVNGSLSFESGSQLNIVPSTVKVTSGTLSIGAQLVGDFAQSDPLRFGYKLITLSSPATPVTLAPAQYNVFVLRFSGTLLQDTKIFFPEVSGYTKIIDNQTSGSFNLLCTTAIIDAEGNIPPVSVINGKQSVIYCDGEVITEVAVTPPNLILDLLNKHESTSFGTSFQTSSGSSFTDLTGYAFSFTNVQTGDIFEISYNAVINAGAATSRIAVATLIGAATNQLSETIFEPVATGSNYGASANTSYIATSNSNLTLKLQFNAAGSSTSILTPLSFTVKHVRP